jgi:cation:H+ antiporter
MEEMFLHFPVYVNILVVLVSLFVLVKAGEYMVEGAVAFGERLKISPLIIGSTVVAMGTSLAELAVNMVVILNGGNTNVILGNILGSNLVNIGIGLGVPAIIMNLNTTMVVMEKEILLYFAITALLTGFASNFVLDKIEGFYLMGSFAVVLFLIYQYAMKERMTTLQKKEFPEDKNKKHMLTTARSMIYLVAGLAGLVLAAKFLVASGSGVAHTFGVSEYIIGLTIIGIGTSFPEIVTSIAAARKGYTDIVLGNVFGSNIFNICFGLGLPMVFKDLGIEKGAFADLYFINGFGLILVFMLLIESRMFGKNKVIGRMGGVIVVLMYTVYIGAKILKLA